MERHFVGVILAMSMATGWAAAQRDPAEKHVADIIGENKAKYPEGVANSQLCQSAKQQHPPYSRFRWHEPDLAKMETDLPSLMRESDEVVMVGHCFRRVTILSPTGEDAVSYSDARVLRTWKGSHMVGDVITIGFLEGTVHCGPGLNEFSGTTTGPSSRFLYQGPNPNFSPDGPYVVFLKRPGENSRIEAFELAGGDKVQGSFDLVPARIDEFSSPYLSCFYASYDPVACHSLPHGWSPEFCRDPKIDAQNIAKCNAALSAGRELIFANGVDQDPVREKYHGRPIRSFLRAVDAAANEQAHPNEALDTIP